MDQPLDSVTPHLLNCERLRIGLVANPCASFPHDNCSHERDMETCIIFCNCRSGITESHEPKHSLGLQLLRLLEIPFPYLLINGKGISRHDVDDISQSRRRKEPP